MGELVRIKHATMEFVSISNGEAIEYQEVGRQTAEILVLIHGAITSAQHFDVVIEKLQEKDQIASLDLRGVGQSTYNLALIHIVRCVRSSLC